MADIDKIKEKLKWIERRINSELSLDERQLLYDEVRRLEGELILNSIPTDMNFNPDPIQVPFDIKDKK